MLTTISRVVPVELRVRATRADRYTVPSRPIDTQGSVAWTYGPPVQVSTEGSTARVQVDPPSWLTATTFPTSSGERFSCQVATSCFGLVGSTASDGSPGWSGAGVRVAQAEGQASGPLMIFGGGRPAPCAWPPWPPAISTVPA